MSDFQIGWRLEMTGKPITYCRNWEQRQGWEAARDRAVGVSCSDAEQKFHLHYSVLADREPKREDDGNVLFA